MTSLSLFHKPTFDRHVYTELPLEEASALLAAMCCLAARHVETDPREAANGSEDGTNRIPSSTFFYELASDAAYKQLKSCGDRPPPLCLLQTLILTTYNELVSSMRGVAWRSLGAVIRMAYELRLHLVDLPSTTQDENASISVDAWIAREERRRAWWSIWEMEVFASTVRRCPNSMDPTQHATLLPVDEKSWFEGKKTPSCFLEADPVNRWKALQKSGNTCSRAWFIVINSLMKDAHCLSNPTVPGRLDHAGDAGPKGDGRLGAGLDIDAQLAVLDNCVSCFGLALPRSLVYRPLLSRMDFDDPAARKTNSDRQTIHVMIQLAKLMVQHRDCFRNDRPTSRLQTPGLGDQSGTGDPPPRSDGCQVLGHNLPSARSGAAWPKYLQAAEQVVSVVRDGYLDPVRDGDPLLANTFWMVAAIQIVHATFTENKSERVIAQTNLDLLRLTLIQHRDFWHSSPNLVQNLENLESALGSIHARMMPRRHAKYAARTEAQSPMKEPQNVSLEFSFIGKNYQLTQTKQSELNSSAAQGMPDTLLQNMERQEANQANAPPMDIAPDAHSCNYGFNEEFPMDLTMDLPLEAIFSGVWEHATQNNDFIFPDDMGHMEVDLDPFCE